MVKKNAKSEAQSARGAEVRPNDDQDFSNRAGGTGEDSGQYELLGLGSGGEVGAGAVVGGILTRMIHDKRDRIREAEECVVWYQREIDKRQTELADLQQLADSLFPDAEAVTQVEDQSSEI